VTQVTTVSDSVAEPVEGVIDSAVVSGGKLSEPLEECAPEAE
jgi:hypothetical protein